MTKDTTKGTAANADEMLSAGIQRERVTFWKGENVGDWLIGRIVGFTSRTFGEQREPTDIAIFQPVAISDGSNWRNVREAQVVLSATLASRISIRTDRGHTFAIRFSGFEPSSKGNDARLYDVVEQTAEKLHEILSVATA